MKQNASWLPRIKPVFFVLLTALSALGAAVRIDLEVEKVQIRPARPKASDSLTVVAVIRNNGSEMAANCYATLSIHQGQRRIKTIQNIPALSTLPRMGSGLSIPIEVGRLPAGDYEAVIQVFQKEGYDEFMGNNKAVQGFRVE